MTYTQFVDQAYQEAKDYYESTTTHSWNTTIAHIHDSFGWEDTQDVDDELLIKVYSLGALHGIRKLSKRLQ